MPHPQTSLKPIARPRPLLQRPAQRLGRLPAVLLCFCSLASLCACTTPAGLGQGLRLPPIPAELLEPPQEPRLLIPRRSLPTPPPKLSPAATTGGVI